MGNYTYPDLNKACNIVSLDNLRSTFGPAREELTEAEFLNSPAVFTSFIAENLSRGIRVVDLLHHLERINSHAKLANISRQLSYTEVLGGITHVFTLPTSARQLRIRLVLSDVRAHLAIQNFSNSMICNSSAVALFPVRARRFMPKLKTLVIGESLRAEEIAIAQRADSALLVDEDERVLEGAWSNIFWVDQNEQLYTTDEERVLSGTVRASLLRDFSVKVCNISFLDLLSEAREIFLTQATRGIIAVSAIKDKTFTPGRRTNEVISWYLDYREQSCHFHS